MVGLGKTVKNVILLKNKVKSKCMNNFHVFITIEQPKLIRNIRV